MIAKELLEKNETEPISGSSTQTQRLQSVQSHKNRYYLNQTITVMSSQTLDMHFSNLFQS